MFGNKKANGANAAATAAATAAKLLSTSAGAGAGAESIAPDRFIVLDAATAATIALVDEVLQRQPQKLPLIIADDRGAGVK